MNSKWMLYILKCADGTFYCGITNDLNKRMKTHSSGKGSKYVRTRLPFEVAYTEPHEDRSSASKQEYLIKQMSRSNKIIYMKRNEKF